MARIIRWSLCFLLLLSGFSGFAQLWRPATPLSADYLLWSPTRRLKASDFQLKVRSQNNLGQSFAEFGIRVSGNKLDLLGKDANYMVHNSFHRPGSYLDSTDATATPLTLLYLQTQWDIYEVAARLLRKQLRSAAKKMILLGKPDATELLRTTYEAANKRVVQYSDETKYGLFLDKQREWERQLAQELTELENFATAY